MGKVWTARWGRLGTSGLLLAVALCALGATRAEAASKPIPGQLMVLFDQSSSAKSRAADHQHVRDALGIDVGVASRSRGVLAFDVVRVPPGRERAALRAYETRDDVLAADEDSVNDTPLAADDCAPPTTCFSPNDPGFTRQWYLQNDSRTIAPPGVVLKEDADLDAPRAWPISRGAGGVAVLDDGLDLSHPDLLRARGSVYDTTGENTIQSVGGHGTHVSGIIAATQDNGVGVTGLAPDSLLYMCRVLQVKKQGNNYTSTGMASWLLGGLNWAMSQPVGVINMSLQNYTYSDTLQAAIDRAWDLGIVLVASAGNSSSSTPNYPAAFDHVVAVASLRADDTISSFSNRGMWVDVAAGGEDVWSTVPTYKNSTGLLNYGYLDGTSMAAPYVSALAAMVGQQVEDDDGTGGKVNDEIVERILATADRIAGSGTNWREGAVNAAQALENADQDRLYAGEVLATPDLLSYWRLNEPNAALGAIDSVGPNSAEYESRAVTGAPYVFEAPGAIATSRDTAVRMPQGVDSTNTLASGAITAYYMPSLALGDEFSVELWVKPLNDPSRPPFSYLFQIGNQNERFYLSGGAGFEYGPLAIVAGSSASRVRSSVPLTYEWNHVVVTRTSTSTRIYVNGADTSTDETPGAVSLTGDQATITFGSVVYSPEAFDELAVYRRALTAAEVMRHYTAATRTGRR